MLKLEGVGFAHGSAQICQDIHLNVEPGEVVCLLGRNGMGKTTLLEGLIGFNRQTSGKILFRGVDISREPTHKRARRGIALVPQGRRIFPGVSVSDNLRLGTLADRTHGQPATKFITDFFPILAQRLSQKGNTLSGGEQQMLAIGRALAGQPALLLLDEPSEGLAPLIVDAISEIIVRLMEQGLAILLAEQNLHFALSVASRGYVLEKGRVVDSGNVSALQNHQVVRDYLMV